MQNFNTNSLNFTSNRLCESGTEKLTRSKRKHSQLYNYDQTNLPLLKKIKNNSNNFPNHISNNFSIPLNYENNNFLTDQKQINNPFLKDSNCKNSRIENSNGIKGINIIAVWKHNYK